MKGIRKTYAGIIMGLVLAAPLCSIPANADDTGEKDPAVADVNENTGKSHLNIGSVSKVYVVAAVMQLSDRGLVDIDAPVTDYIPDFKMADPRYKDITVRMLMNHTSGLMGTEYGGSFLFDEAANDYHDGFLEHLKTQYLKADPGAFNCYCNDGFTLLEILVERLSGMNYTEYVEEYICKPLALDNTGTMWNMDINAQVPIYVNGNTRIAHECTQLLGAGGIMADASDVCTFGSAFFNGNDLLLSDVAKKKMAESNRAGDGAENFGLGWDEVGKKDYANAGVQVLSKGGDTIFQHASLVVAPDEEISVAVLSSGGGSGWNEEMALKLMDIALSEQGINIEHPEEKKPELMDTVPEELLSYEGLYADQEKTMLITFPEKKYMLVTSLTANDGFEVQYMYTKDGSFVKMNGDVSSGKAIPAQPLSGVDFEEKDGQIYITDPNMGAILYKAAEKSVDEKIQTAWDARNGVSYYLVNLAASDMTYMIGNNCLTLHTSDAAKGYVNAYVMQDENHAGYDHIIPGTVSRDLSNLRVEAEDGKEYMCMDEIGYRFISEKNIPAWTDEITEVQLNTDEACWYRLDGTKGISLRLKRPEKAAVYVFDKYKNLRYSSYMAGYGDEVPLPEYGMIVFTGVTGESVGVEQLK